MNSKSVSSALILFGQGLNTFVNLLFLPYLSRAMSIGDYGTYGQSLLVVDLSTVLFQFGLYKIIYVFFSDPEIDNGTILKNNVLMSLLLSIIPLTVLIIFSNLIGNVFSNPDLSKLIKLYSWSIPFTLVNQSLFASLIYFKKVRESVTLSISINLIKIALVFIAVQIYNSLEFIFISIVLTSILQFFLNLYYLPSELNRGKLNLPLAWNQFKAGYVYGLTSIMGTGFRYVDGLIISLFLSTKDYAIYRNGAFELPFIGALSASIGVAILPDLAVYYRNKNFNEIIRLKRQSIMITSAIIIPIVTFLVFFSKPIIVTYLSEAYEASSNIFLIYSLILLIRVTDYQSLFILSGDNISQLLIYVFIFIFNLGLNILLINTIGLTGPAIASVICNFILIYLLLYFGNKNILMPWHAFFDFKSLSKIAILSSITILPIVITWKILSPSSGAFIIFFLAYMPIILHILLRNQLAENQLIFSLLKRFSTPEKLLRSYSRYYLKN